jgi:hypothetical protein
MDTHALSVPALTSALEVLAANGVEVMLAEGDEYTPTPAVSHAILAHNRERKIGLATKPMFVVPNHMLARFSSELLTPRPSRKATAWQATPLRCARNDNRSI